MSLLWHFGSRWLSICRSFMSVSDRPVFKLVFFCVIRHSDLKCCWSALILTSKFCLVRSLRCCGGKHSTGWFCFKSLIEFLPGARFYHLLRRCSMVFPIWIQTWAAALCWLCKVSQQGVWHCMAVGCCATADPNSTSLQCEQSLATFMNTPAQPR